MKLKDYRNDYYVFSGKASDVARQLAFAGIALIWIFKTDSTGAMALPQATLGSAIAFVFALSLDLLQYLFAALIWSLFSRYHETKGIKDEDDLQAPSYFNWPTLGCFWLKSVSVVIGYGGLLMYTSQLLKWL